MLSKQRVKGKNQEARQYNGIIQTYKILAFDYQISNLTARVGNDIAPPEI